MRSLTSTRMIDKLGEAYGVPVHETPVGFKYLGPKMMEAGAIAAGEESGGYAFAAHLPERDGAYAGLLILDLLARSGKTPSQLVAELYAKVGEHFYDRIDVHLQDGEREAAIASVAAAAPDSLAGRKVLKQRQPGRLPLRVRRRLAGHPPLRHRAPPAHLHRGHRQGAREARARSRPRARRRLGTPAPKMRRVFVDTNLAAASV